VKKALEDNKENKDLEASLVNKALKVKTVLKAQQALKDYRVTLVHKALKVHKVCLAQLVFKVVPDSRVLPVQLVKPTSHTTLMPLETMTRTT
jgi:hypothetical protein